MVVRAKLLKYANFVSTVQRSFELMIVQDKRVFNPYPYPGSDSLSVQDYPMNNPLALGEPTIDKDKYDPSVTWSTYTRSLYCEVSGQTLSNETRARQREFLQMSSHFDKFMPKLFRPAIKKAVLRVFVIHLESRTMRFFPGHDMEKNYDPKTELYWDDINKIEEKNSAIPKIYGPFPDKKTGGRTIIMTIGSTVFRDSARYAFVGVDIALRDFDTIFEDIGYMNGISTMVKRDKASVLHIPDQWQKNKAYPYSLWLLEQSGMTEAMWSEILQKNLSSIDLPQDSNSKMKPTKVAIEYIDMAEYSDGGDYAYMYYVHMDNILDISVRLEDKIRRQRDLIVFLGVIVSIFALAIVTCCSYKVSHTISQQIKGFTKMCDQLNKNVTEKDLLQTMDLKKYEDGDGQIKNLVGLMKKRVEDIDNENKKKQLSGRIVHYEYPPNLYQKDLADTGKGISLHHWFSVINEVPEHA
eukprot:TRINITY_DN4462_c0_g1_i4.p2 TRINITY_DN4462_c0_g1~~TRINITY_DN4462_c0_g1_i4.p2  ORF type:complete len:467 (+),score=110.45 TRINITY_DN4462_c0_g1_i4:3806-5206(+)